MSTKTARLPRHRNPEPDQTARIACAPYNFVELPTSGVPAAAPDQSPRHDVYDADRHTGHFAVTLETLTPTYVRCAFTPDQYRQAKAEEEEERRNAAANGDSSDDGAGQQGEGNGRSFRTLARNTPHFFYTRDEAEPVIPGSSLRGMLRSLVEIASFGRMERVSETRLFYRSMDGSSLSNDYVGRMVNDEYEQSSGPYWNQNRGFKSGPPKCPVYIPKVGTGILRQRRDGKWQIEVCPVARIEEKSLLPPGDRAYGGPGAGNDPKWNVNGHGLQHADIWVSVDSQEQDYFFPAAFTPGNPPRKRHDDMFLPMRRAWNPTFTLPANGPAREQGILVLTGRMQNKHMAFVFLPDQATGEVVDIPNDANDPDINNRIIDLFHEHQLTPFQRRVFPKDQPQKGCRSAGGHLRDGEPVFFLMEEEKFVFLGRCQMFRLPYTNRPIDLIPPELYRSATLDYADALFGYIRDKKTAPKAKAGTRERALAGRVFVSSARCDQSGADAFVDTSGMPGEVLTPRILATPKATCFQHYLVQTDPGTDQDRNSYKRLAHYGNDRTQTALRGFKRYWHQGNIAPASLLEDNREHLREVPQGQPRPQPGDVKPLSTQHTQMRPVKAGVTFRFEVRFENLTTEELGALWWALRPRGEAGADYCHKIGMGKPYGMGSVRLNATLHLSDRAARYRTLFAENGGGWAEPEPPSPVSYEDATQAFEKHILGQYRWATSDGDAAPTRLADTHRIAQLLAMMRWPGIPRRSALDGVPADRQNRHTNHAPNSRYMQIELKGVSEASNRNEYRARPVLPEPLWPGYHGPTFARATDVASSARLRPAAPQVTTPTEDPINITAIKEAQAAAAEARRRANRKVTVEAEVVSVKPGKARIRVDGVEVPCPNLVDRYDRTNRCRAEVQYKDGKPVSARFRNFV